MRASDSEALRGFPRAWFCRALWEYDGDLAELNAQLALKAEPQHPFVVGVWPRPYHPRAIAPPFFDRALAGRNPDNWEWVDRADYTRCFNLFLRVAIHLPGSEDWLFRGMHPYLRSTPPSIDYAHKLMKVSLQRLGLRVLPGHALETVVRLAPDRGRELAKRGVDHLVKAAQPLHITTLFSLWHLVHWQRPYSTHAEDLFSACCVALRHFLGRPEFQVNECARAAAKHVEHSLQEIRSFIRYEGFRLPRPPNGLDRIGSFPLLVKDFDDLDAVIGCASAGTAIPTDDFLCYEPSAYRQDAVPSSGELEVVTEVLLRAADFADTDMLHYARDPAVLQELREPLERPVVRRRVAARA